MKGLAQGPHPLAAPYLGPLVQEGIPDPKEDVANETVCKDHEEPVEGDEGEIHVVLPQVGHQPGQLLREQVLEHPLVHLEASEGACHLQPQDKAASLPAQPSYPVSPHSPEAALGKFFPAPQGARAQSSWESGTASYHSTAPDIGQSPLDQGTGLCSGAVWAGMFSAPSPI